MDKDIRLLEQILNDSNEMIQVSDIESFSMMYANKPAKKYTGHANQEYKGRHCYEYMMGLSEQCPFCPMRQLEEQDSFETEVDNGKEIYAVKTRKIEWEGKPAFIEYAWDITDIRRSQKIYESQVQTLISAIPDAQGIFHMDVTDDTVFTVNGNSAEVAKMQGKMSVDDMIRMISGYVPEESDREAFFSFFKRESLRNAYDRGKAELNREVKSYFDDGSIRDARITGRLLMNPQTNHLECIIYGMDISEEKRKEREAEDALRNALAVAEHANRAKTAFLNNMSHDIRTPMNAIIGYTALAATHIDSRELVQDYLNKINISSTHLLSLINDVLDMSRIESGSVKIEENEVHIPDVLHDLRTIIQGNVTAKQLDLYIDTQDVIHEDIITDKLRLNQVLINIISNAVKFTPVGGMINIRVSEKPCNIKGYTTFDFSIRDNGIGMSEEFQKHVFDSFARERTTTQSGITGTGLGMAITKNIVNMMGGTISVKSEEGKGTEFVVSMNCQPSGKKISYGPIPELQGARALVVDDDINTCMSVSKMLRSIDMRADWTASGKEAVVRAREAFEQNDEFKAYIIDWLMPDMNGIETVRRIRNVVGEGTPIIILTAYDWSDIEKEAREAGVTAFVAKPIFMSELRSVLTRPIVIEKEEVQAEYSNCKDKRILLVEDNELNREIAEELLTDAGLLVDSVEDGLDAVERMNSAAGEQYDLILMDIQMPKMDGYTATREIRTLANNKVANIPIVAMTANAFEEDKKKAFKAGMNAHIAKPIDRKILVKVLEEIFKAQE